MDYTFDVTFLKSQEFKHSPSVNRHVYRLQWQIVDPILCVHCSVKPQTWHRWLTDLWLCASDAVWADMGNLILVPKIASCVLFATDTKINQRRREKKKICVLSAERFDAQCHKNEALILQVTYQLCKKKELWSSLGVWH